MLIIRMWGGLGNQLFLYGLYRKIISMDKEAYIYMDKEYYATQTNQNLIYQLPLLGIEPREYPKSDDIQKYLTSDKIFIRIKRKFDKRFYYEHEHGKFDPNVLKVDNKFLIGYFQSEKYFEDISETIRKEIMFRGTNNPKVSEIVKKLKNENSVAIHMRLTDYQTNIDIYGGICDLQYYRKACEFIRSKIKNPVFYLFSDDLPLAENLLKKDLKCN